jgi:hypothetical protein
MQSAAELCAGFCGQGRGGTEPTTEPAVMICDDECCAIGRHANCNLILDDPTVSISVPFGVLASVSCALVSL